MKLAYQYMAIFFTLSPTSNHLHPLQVENCDSNSRLVVDGNDNVKSGLKGLHCTYTNNIGIQMKRKELTKTFMMISFMMISAL